MIFFGHESHFSRSVLSIVSTDLNMYVFQQAIHQQLPFWPSMAAKCARMIIDTGSCSDKDEKNSGESKAGQVNRNAM